MNKYLKSLELDSVLKMLANLCQSGTAKKRALSLAPSSDPAEVNRLLRQTQDAETLSTAFGAPSFGGIADLSDPLSRAAAGSSLSPRELLEIGRVLRTIRLIEQWRHHLKEQKTTLDFLFEGLSPNKYLENKILNAIISEDEIADEASPELAEIRRKIKAKSNSIREKLDGIIHSEHYRPLLQDPIITQRGGRYVVPVKNERRSEFPGIVHDVSSSGATAFVEPASVVNANNDIRELQSRERDEIRKILASLSAEAASFKDSILDSCRLASILDLIFAKASLGIKMRAFAPKINTGGRIILNGARHPLIDPQKVVATDISLGAEFDTLIITGPNTGGKTVSIKTIGLLTAMAMCGLMIPAEEGSEISVFGSILVDIGDEQSIEQNLSTFSGHISNIIKIINSAGEDSLVLIDELGAGTDPTEGAALAVAIIEELRTKHAKIAATTHYSELKAYALETPGVMNASCEFDVKTLSPTYHLLMGIPGKSNAFAISRRLGMSEDVITRAEGIIKSEDRNFENVLSSLEQLRLELAGEKEKSRRALESADRMRRRAQSEKDKIRQGADLELDRARHKAEKIVEDAERESRNYLLELERLKRESEGENATQAAKRARRFVRTHSGKLREITNPQTLAMNWDDDYKLPRPVKPGDFVIVRSIGRGRVIEVSKNNVLVQCGSLETRVKLSDLMLDESHVPEKPRSQKATVYRTTSKADSDFSTELDLRGDTVSEALSKLDTFIDRCVLSGIDQIRIIHGKGTGALRKAVTDYLKKHPNISEYRLGQAGEGDTGVTIAKLK